MLAFSVLLLAAGLWTARDMPVDVFPDLTPPTVTILTEGPQEYVPQAVGRARSAEEIGGSQVRTRSNSPHGWTANSTCCSASSPHTAR
ncbi:MAG: hypothetical protein ABL982_12420 [Vicinamibacterales bacterium]